MLRGHLDYCTDTAVTREQLPFFVSVSRSGIACVGAHPMSIGIHVRHPCTVLWKKWDETIGDGEYYSRDMPFSDSRISSQLNECVWGSSMSLHVLISNSVDHNPNSSLNGSLL